MSESTYHPKHMAMEERQEGYEYLTAERGISHGVL
jgi:hypothetical protein